ncbi:MAG: hypothetical protein U0271_46090 [Polyangiaceae bacterium]
MRLRRTFLYAGLAFVAPTLLLAAAVPACKTRVVVPNDGGGGQGGEGTGLIPIGPGGGGADAGHDALEEYVDPGCKDTPPPIEDFQCDPDHQGNGDCFDGEACYIYVDNPEDPCGQEIYGSVCLAAGPGQQGDPCSGAQDCGAGLVCVVTGSGTQCVVMCSLDGPNNCPDGLICEAIDVEGFGGCL